MAGALSRSADPAPAGCGLRSGGIKAVSRAATVVALAALVAAVAMPRSARAGDTAFGEYLSSECVTCHRVDGQDKGIPPIIGWPADQFVAVLNSYKKQERPNAVMQTIAGRLGEPEMAALAAYFGSLQPAK